MILQNRHLEKALNDLEAAYESVPGDQHEYEDNAMALEIVERALAQALRTSVDLLLLLDPTDIMELEPPLKAHVGRMLTVRAILQYDLGQRDFAAHSTRLACQAFRDTLEFRFADEGRYAANHLHQLLTRDVAGLALHPHEAADCYEELFDHYASRQIFDRAEDMLFFALELTDQPRALLARGIGFYDTLQKLETVELQRHGLPRHEVNESRRELEERLRRIDAD
jgi:hypothetical protein